jgi:hypothetical protein
MGLFRRRDPRTNATFAGLDPEMAELYERRRQLLQEHAELERERLEAEAYFERWHLESQRARDEYCLQRGIEIETCTWCYGTGRVKVDCSTCRGRGYRDDYGDSWGRMRCTWCHGDGQEKKDCSDCGGSGRRD